MEGSSMVRNDNEKKRSRWIEEVEKGGRIAAPMVAVAVAQYLVQVVSLIMVGHLGQLSLASIAIATSLTNVSGFSLLSGMAGGLETLCGQAYGAEQYHKLGIYTYTAIISLSVVCVPISLAWSFMHKLLPHLGQDPVISMEARTYSMWLIPALFASAILKPLSRYFQTQSLIFPLLLSSSLALCLHAVTCWNLVFKLELGLVGAGISFSVCAWFNVILLVLYMKYSSACEKTRIGFTKQGLLGMSEFFHFAVPSALMVCLKWWACELFVLLAGLFPNPKLETSVFSICLTISTLHFTIPYGFGAAASTRVANEVGAGNVEAAKVAVGVWMIVGVTEGGIVSGTLWGLRHVLGYAFNSDHEVVRYVASITPLLSLSIFFDSFQAVLSGVARGCGWQHVGAYVNIGAFYVVGVPVGALLAFPAHFRTKGLWIGLLSGSLLQSSLLSLITYLTNWSSQAKRARQRIFDSRSPDANETVNHP
ncbi:protein DETOXIFICATION 14-like [Prosopis cineraria]|uniref:protein DETOXIFICATION 14-like n=1 Tax=Prosopis cineraria TaxID=364024 RepID=UPI002410A9ED|nr:protein DETOXIFICATION 14-like [Prosopis cineraria]